MGLLNAILGLKDVDVTGNKQVGTLKKEFKESFGTEIRVYKSTNTGAGSKRADDKSTLASVCEKTVTGMTIKKNQTVGDIEDQFRDDMGIGIQIMDPSGEKFAPNAMRLKDISKNMS